MVRHYCKVVNERDEFRETLAANPEIIGLKAILSQAKGTPLEGAETT